MVSKDKTNQHNSMVWEDYMSRRKGQQGRGLHVQKGRTAGQRVTCAEEKDSETEGYLWRRRDSETENEAGTLIGKRFVASTSKLYVTSPQVSRYTTIKTEEVQCKIKKDSKRHM